MMPVPKKSTSTSYNPRITQLPADVIHLILTFVPIKEAARTSILSTEWRHRWRSIPHLVFDGNFATFYSITHLNLDRVMLNVSQALLVHQGPINKFVLAIPEMQFCPQLHQLILHLSSKSVNELSLLFSVIGTYIPLPSLLFDFPNLSSLRLQGFVFRPPMSKGFSKLTSLILNDVQLPIDFFDEFLPKCPLLQELNVLKCHVDNNKQPVLATSPVKVLVFHSALRSIRISNYSVVRPDHDFFGEFKPDMVALFGSLPSLEQLNLGLDFLLFLSKSNDVPYQLPVPLCDLTVLEIPSLLLGRTAEPRLVACLIRSSPNLRKLTIGHHSHGPYWSSDDLSGGLQKLLEPEDNNHEVCCLQRLEELNIQNTSGIQVELELMRFVLANAPLLKRVFVKPRKGLTPETTNRCLMAVIQFKRISKEAVVKYDEA